MNPLTTATATPQYSVGSNGATNQSRCVYRGCATHPVCIADTQSEAEIICDALNAAQPQAVRTISTYPPTTATAHTPEPWQLSASGVLITAEHDGVVTHIAQIVESGVCAPSPREAQANGVLIASAPDLLAERDKLRSEWERLSDALTLEVGARHKLRAEVESLRAVMEDAAHRSTRGFTTDVAARLRAALERSEP